MDYFIFVLKKFIPPLSIIGIATAYAFWNPNLLKAARQTGINLGMGYNYFKVVVKFLTPESEQANRIIAEFRKGSQQAHAVMREIKENTEKMNE